MRKLCIAAVALCALSIPLLASPSAESVASAYRGIWLWGVPHGPFDEEMLAVSNEWAQEKFGVTFSRVDKVPPDMTADQGLQLVIASGEFPDIMWNMPFTTMSDLAAGGRLLALDRYFDNPQGYPIIGNACDSFMSKYKVNGQIYGLPGWEWSIRCSDVAVDALWIQRKDLFEQFGTPTTTDELLTGLRRVKNSNLTDLEGDPLIPFAFRTAWAGVPPRVIYQLKGAGWQVDSQKRLMPPWASEETHDSFQFLNQLWNEGLLWEGNFVSDTAGFQAQLKVGNFAFAAGEPWYRSLMTDTIAGLVDQHGRNSSQVAQAIDYQHVMLVNPISEKPGRIVNKQPNPTLISADVPNPDGLMRMIEWNLSDEGRISNHFEAGYRGVHWDFVDGPEYWRLKPEYATGNNPQHTQTLANTGESMETIRASGRAPLITPHFNWIATPNYSSWQARMLYQSLETMRANGVAIGAEPGDATSPEWHSAFTIPLAEIVSPIPSYEQLTVPLPPREASAEATAGERFDAAVATLIQSDNFEADYDAWLASMISITDWKSIYETRQKRWLDWMQSNNVDDRATLATVTARGEWRTEMGW